MSWITASLNEEAEVPWNSRLQSCLDLLQEDFVGIVDDTNEMNIHDMASLAACLIDTHLTVCVSESELAHSLVQLVRRGLPAAPVSVYVALLSGAVTRPHHGGSAVMAAGQ